MDSEFLLEILNHWDSEDGITFYDPTDRETWYNFATEVLHVDQTLYDEEELYHVGKNKYESSKGIGSGRYPLGSGEDTFQHKSNEFYKTYRRLKKSGFTEKQVADYFEIPVKQLRAQVTLAKKDQNEIETRVCKSLRDQGFSVPEIAQKTGWAERTIYLRLNPKYNPKHDSIDTVSQRLSDELSRKKYLDIGEGVELNLNVSKEKLEAAVKTITDTGEYVVIPNFKLPQPTNPGKQTTIKVLAPAGTTPGDVRKNLEDLKSVDDYYPKDEDSGKNKLGIHDPVPVKMSRIYIRYPEEGGDLKDGTIELRRGVEDLSLGSSQYAQVRIATDNGLYLKGVALYTNDIPKGYDIVFNTSKSSQKPLDKVLKPMYEKSPDNPFGATINAQRGVLNIVNEEGDWEDWSKTLSSQFLSKQPKELVEKQLKLAYADKVEQYDTIMSIPNPTVRKVLLEEFSQVCDRAAIDLKGAAVPGQSNRLILPVTDLKPNEVYAPGYDDGTSLCLVRHPHAGTFEIPRLIVNNKNKQAAELLGNCQDAIGINPVAAKQLSGADFDGDTVVVIPESHTVKVTTRPYLEGLKTFSPDAEYPLKPGMPHVKDQKSFRKQLEMGKISNLITDMTLRGAPDEELERAVKHSMVIIDAEKHDLDWQGSYEENKIADLKLKYQGGKNAGAGSLISRAKGQDSVNERKQVYLENSIDKKTGELLYQYTGRTIRRKQLDPVTKEPIKDPNTGKTLYYDTGELAKDKVTKMEAAFIRGKDAFALSSGTVKETLYAEYANNMHALANKARLSYLEAVNSQKARDPEAASTYKDQVQILDEEYLMAKKNAPRERQAVTLANIQIKAMIDADPTLLDPERSEHLSRAKAQCLTGARVAVGASKHKVHFDAKSWEAVEANAISHTKLEKLLRNADMEQVKKLAMPKQSTVLSPAKLSLIRSMSASGHTMAEIAKRLGISATTVNKALHDKEL